MGRSRFDTEELIVANNDTSIEYVGKPMIEENFNKSAYARDMRLLAMGKLTKNERAMGNRRKAGRTRGN